MPNIHPIPGGEKIRLEYQKAKPFFGGWSVSGEVVISLYVGCLVGIALTSKIAGFW